MVDEVVLVRGSQIVVVVVPEVAVCGGALRSVFVSVFPSGKTLDIAVYCKCLCKLNRQFVRKK